MPEPGQFECWKCGTDLKSVPRPFSRFAECTACKTELHVCRMCRHYNPRYVGQCDHDFADKVLVKDKSNFCSHFRPRSGAYQGGAGGEREKAQEELESLFGSGTQSSGPSTDEPRSEAEAARRKLDDLFGE